jgi:hypothetical protein
VTLAISTSNEDCIFVLTESQVARLRRILQQPQHLQDVEAACLNTCKMLRLLAKPPRRLASLALEKSTQQETPL